MSKPVAIKILTILAAVAAAGLFVASLKLPLWHLRMEAPQYKDEEALKVHVYPGAMTGDLKEIKVLNQYIGVHVPEALPQLKWLPIALLASAALGILSVALPLWLRSRVLLVSAALLSMTMLISAGTAQWQMHKIGHARDQHTILKGVHDFTPPLLGKVKVANFEITAFFGTGAFLTMAGIVLQIGAAVYCRKALREIAPHKTAEAGHWWQLTFRSHAV